MKLRNKRTGEIGELKPFVVDERIAVWVDNKSHPEYRYNSLAELNEEWEDYEEPEESEYYWYIGYKNDIRRTKYHHISDFADNQVTATRKEIGNCFGSLEEAEKAVEKLKAWKRLKDKGFRFDGWDENHHNLGIIEFSFDKVENNVWDFEKDLDLLFGGEE